MNKIDITKKSLFMFVNNGITYSPKTLAKWLSEVDDQEDFADIIMEAREVRQRNKKDNQDVRILH